MKSKQWIVSDWGTWIDIGPDDEMKARIVIPDHGDREEALESAEMIARAVNSHDALLSACQSLLHFADLTGWGDLALAGSGNEQQDMLSIRTVELARAAIAQATGNAIPTPKVSENLNQPL